MSGPRFFIGKHPCDDQPYIHDVDPDPRSGDSHFTHDGPDYSGWYVREETGVTDEMVEAGARALQSRFGDGEWTHTETMVRAVLEAALTAGSSPAR